MAILGRQKLPSLSEEDLDRHPVWAEDDSGDYWQPVLPAEPIPEDMGLLCIRASFTTPSGLKLSGYLVDPIPPYPPHAIGLFVEGERFIFNTNLKKLAEKNVQTVQELLGAATAVFPMVYETGLLTIEGTELTGVFDPWDDLNAEHERRA